MGRYFVDEEVITELYQYNHQLFERKNIANEKEDIVNELLPLWEKGNTLN